MCLASFPLPVIFFKQRLKIYANAILLNQMVLWCKITFLVISLSDFPVTSYSLPRSKTKAGISHHFFMVVCLLQ
jgi:hypothetical protein